MTFSRRIATGLVAAFMATTVGTADAGFGWFHRDSQECECEDCCEKCEKKKHRCCLVPTPAPRGGVVDVTTARFSDRSAEQAVQDADAKRGASSTDERLRKLETNVEIISIQLKLLSQQIGK